MGKSRKSRGRAQPPPIKPPATAPQTVEPSEIEEKNKSGTKKITVAQRHETFVGPIPPPKVLKEYGEVMPDLPERIVSSWEKEQEHRRKGENAMIDGSLKLDTRAQWLAFIIGISFLLLAAYTLYQEKYLYGSLFGIIPTSFLILGSGFFNRLWKQFQKQKVDKKDDQTD